MNYQYIIPLGCYYEMGDFINGLACVVGVRNGGIGMINIKGEIVIPCIYDSIGYFNDDDITFIQFKGKWGYINREGVEVIPCIYDDVHPFDCGLAKVRLNGLWGYINTKGDIVIPIKYTILGNFNYDGKATAILYGCYGHIDKNDRFFRNGFISV